MSSVLLIYPYFKPHHDRSAFRFPPLGIAYLAAGLLQAGHTVHVLDCTFMRREEALAQALAYKAEVVGIYCMVTMLEDCQWFAGQLRRQSKLLVAGGPLPTCDPLPFLAHFDVVVRGEGERTLPELLDAFETGADLNSVAGIVYRSASGGKGDGAGDGIHTPPRPFEKHLDRLPFPARHLLPNADYVHYGRQKYGYAITTLMSTRGCPFRCEFCSNVIFGASYRQRSAQNVVDEIEDILRLGYDWISFADDVFTLNRDRVLQICAEISRRGLNFSWECLGRVDALDYDAFVEMKKAGCARIFFGIESGNDRVLKLMDKHITTHQARSAVEQAHRAGLNVGAFFILFYPGETAETVLETLRFATSLPLDYLGLSMPYPLPGTALYERVKDRITRSWRPGENLFTNHAVIYRGDFSAPRMWFGLLKGHTQFEIKRRMGKLAPLCLKLFEKPSDALFRLLR
jgi:anaerobic magnesium-protoporphyrin IX monomethyl ester cyclase